tara:strand:+ start:3723 stop:4136 length:414 start_codon:yes stop_codon:yes gene_type:complete
MGNEEEFVVDLTTATAEVNAWLDHKKVKTKKRKSYEEQIDNLIEAICTGQLSMNDETFEFTQTLQFPIGKDNRDTLVYKPRVSVGAFYVHLKGVKADDVDGRIFAYVAGLTGNLVAVITKVDPEDYDICKDIAVFFL